MNTQASELSWLNTPVAPICQSSQQQARLRQNQLTKPPGSLGELENLAVRFAGFQGTEQAQLNALCIRVFAADHGVCAQGVSAFPQVVTTQMIENFVRGGAAISVLAKNLKNNMAADFKVFNMGVAHPLISEAGVENNPIAPGTQDFTRGPAMSPQQCAQALNAGRHAVQKADIFIGGEMGIGNTTAASALYSALLSLAPAQTVGPGTGVDTRTQQHKADIIARALNTHAALIENAEPVNVLRAVGGLEIAALTGAYISAAQQGIPSLVDGFISTAAALLACKINAGVKDWLLYSHCSAEPAHRMALDALGATPLLNLQLRLGEGSGAALAIPLIQAALLLHSQMATFEKAGVSEA